MPQTSVATTPDAGLYGQMTDCARGEPLSLVNEESSAEIAFGLMVKRGTADGSCKLLSAVTDRVAGISVHHHPYAADVEVGDTGVKPTFMLGVCGIGSVNVFVEDAVDQGDEVHVRVLASDGQPAGSFRGSIDGNHLTIADTVFTAEADDEKMTSVAHGLQTGDGPVQVSNAGGGLPAGLTALTDYWIIRIDADTFYFATSRANALAGSHVSITTDGTGTQTLKDKTFTFTADNTTNIFAATAHGRVTGDGPHRVANSGGALPAGLSAVVDYWIIKTDDDHFKLALSFADALAGTAVDITTNGTGTQTMTAGTERVATINCSAFAKWRRGAAARGVAVVELDCRNASLAEVG